MTPLRGNALAIYNEVSAACVADSRQRLGRALWRAWKLDKGLAARCMYHASYVGWPMRHRPNGMWT